MTRFYVVLWIYVACLGLVSGHGDIPNARRHSGVRARLWGRAMRVWTPRQGPARRSVSEHGSMPEPFLENSSPGWTFDNVYNVAHWDGATKLLVPLPPSLFLQPDPRPSKKASSKNSSISVNMATLPLGFPIRASASPCLTKCLQAAARSSARKMNPTTKLVSLLPVSPLQLRMMRQTMMRHCRSAHRSLLRL